MIDLLDAAIDGDIDRVRALLKQNVDVNEVGDYYDDDREVSVYDVTALHCAARNGHVAVVQTLLVIGAKVDNKQRDGKMALHEAANNGHTEIVKLLLDKGARNNAADDSGSTALHLAAANGHIAVAQLLLNSGAAIVKDENGQTALHNAAIHGHKDIVQLLLNFNAAVDDKDNNGRTPLIWAQAQGHVNIVALLEAALLAQHEPTMLEAPAVTTPEAKTFRGFSFGTRASASPAAVTTPEAKPVGGFSFGTLASASPAAATTPEAQTFRGFSFGALASASPAVTTPAPAAVAAATFSFRTLGAPAPTAVAAPRFPFGAPVAPAPTAVAAPRFSFGALGASAANISSPAATSTVSAPTQESPAPIVREVDWQLALSNAGLQSQLKSMQEVISAIDRDRLKLHGIELAAVSQKRLVELEEHRRIQLAQIDVVETLLSAGVDASVVHRIHDVADDVLKSVGSIANSFSAARLALDGARSARSLLASIEVILQLVAESASADGMFGTVAALCTCATEFADAERAFVAHQDALRAAKELDAQAVLARDAARQKLAHIAASILDIHEKAPLGALTALGNRAAPAHAALAGLQSGDDNDNVAFDDWLANARKSTVDKSAQTERCFEALAKTVHSLCDGAHNDAGGQHVASALVRARISAELEMYSLDALRVPGAAYSELVAKLNAVRAQVAESIDLVDRARRVRVVETPSGARLQAAQTSVAKLERQIKLARVDVEHPENAESEAAAKTQLLALKAALNEAKSESTAAVVELAAHAFDFPELRLRFPKARFDDFFAADGDASALRTLELYENRVVIAKTRNDVERASFNGVECALKLFRLMPANQRAFFKEARLLRQLAHPNVVEVRAAFVDCATGVIEMPLYAHGDLWQWLEVARRTVHDKLRVLRATLCGLEHVHRMGVVHADVKPENVFVDSQGVAKLGDFDVSKDESTRVTMATTVVGFSLAYAAPEIVRGKSASKASDMYAYGLTLFDVVIGTRSITERPVNVELLAPHERTENGTSLRDLVRRLVDEVATNRISASDALKSPLFAPPPPGRDPEHDRRDCSVCCETFWLDQGISCDHLHFVCNDDMDGMAKSFCSLPLAEIAKRGALRCQERSCSAVSWSNAALAQSLSEAQFTAYIQKLHEVSENRVLVEQRQLHEAALAQQERRLRGEMALSEEVATHRRVICDDLLCLRCPRCKSAFIVDDFKRCLAMTCANCQAGFCAWCLHDCGRDAHQHVNDCEHNPTQPRNLFSNVAQFEEAHRKRGAAVVGEYIRTLRNDEIRAAVRAAIQRYLDDLKIVLTI